MYIQQQEQVICNQVFTKEVLSAILGEKVDETSVQFRISKSDKTSSIVQIIWYCNDSDM
jgi:hypothetical protein